MKNNTFLKIFIISFLLFNKNIFAESKQWEYCVVSFGKAYFNDIENSHPSYGRILYSADTAKDIESNLNILGKLGWEVIDVIGAIGGDQEFLMKREVGLLTPEKEELLIASINNENTRILLDSLNKAQEERDAFPFIELANRRWQEEYNTKKEKYRDEYEKIQDFFKTYPNVVEVIGEENPIFNSDIHIKCDLTSILKNDIEYEQSEIKSYLDKCTNRLTYIVDYSNFMYSSDSINCIFEVYFNYRGKEYSIYSYEYKLEKSYK